MFIMQGEQKLSGQQRIAKTCWYWGPLLGYCAVIFYFSHLSEPTSGVDLPINDKVIHFLQYFPLPFLFFRTFRNAATRFFTEHAIALGIIFSIAYAGSDEIHQAFIALRDPSLYDFFADVGCIVAGALIMKEVTW